MKNCSRLILVIIVALIGTLFFAQTTAFCMEATELQETCSAKLSVLEELGVKVSIYDKEELTDEQIELIPDSNSEVEDMEVSYLMLEDSLIGYAQMQTWGVYLLEGYSVINDAGNSRVGMGGVTNAAKRCTVSVNTILERKVNGSWNRVTSFSSTNENAIYASVSKYVSVTSGYYYRVRSSHIAGSDASASYTDALRM